MAWEFQQRYQTLKDAKRSAKNEYQLRNESRADPAEPCVHRSIEIIRTLKMKKKKEQSSHELRVSIIDLTTMELGFLEGEETG